MRKHSSKQFNFFVLLATVMFANIIACSQEYISPAANCTHQRISINEGWHFYKYDSISKADNLFYDVRSIISNYADNKVADAKPTEASKVEVIQQFLNRGYIVVTIKSNGLVGS